MKSESYNYIFKIISHLKIFHNVSFFITPLDYDVLYSWYDKKIPLNIIFFSLKRVVKRRESKGKDVISISNFSYEVRKNYKLYLERKAGSHDVEDKHEEQIQQSRLPLPQELDSLYLEVEQNCNSEETKDKFKEKLLLYFKDDEELNLQTEAFMNNLSPSLRLEKYRKEFKLNYLINKFKLDLLN